MKSVKSKDFSPVMNIPAVRVTEYKPKFAIPVRMCDLQNSSNKKTEKVATPKPVKYAIPVRMCDLILPDMTSKSKTPTSTATKYAVPVRFLGNAATPQEERPKKTARKQLWSSHKAKKLGGSMKPSRSQPSINIKKLDNIRPLLDLEKFEKNPNTFKKPLVQENSTLKYTKSARFTLANTTKPAGKTPDKSKVRFTLHTTKTTLKTPTKSDTPKTKITTFDTDICRKLDELQLAISAVNERLDRIEKKCVCSCSCNLNKTNNELDIKENVIITPKINELLNSEILNIDEKQKKLKVAKNKFELLEQKLNRGSPMSELSLSDTESPIVRNTISDLILDKTDLKKSFSLTNLATSNKKFEKKDVRSAYDEIRSSANFLCTPKHVTKACNLMTPSVRLSKNKLVSRTVQKQLLMLDDQ